MMPLLSIVGFGGAIVALTLQRHGVAYKNGVFVCRAHEDCLADDELARVCAKERMKPLAPKPEDKP